MYVRVYLPVDPNRPPNRDASTRTSAWAIERNAWETQRAFRGKSRSSPSGKSRLDSGSMEARIRARSVVVESLPRLVESRNRKALDKISSILTRNFSKVRQSSSVSTLKINKYWRFLFVRLRDYTLWGISVPSNVETRSSASRTRWWEVAICFFPWAFVSGNFDTRRRDVNMGKKSYPWLLSLIAVDPIDPLW